MTSFEAHLTFSIELPWQQTTYEPLKSLALFYRWEGGIGKWVFKMKDLKQVELIIGKTILIPEFRDQFNKETIIVPRFKGKDFVEIKEYPMIYQIIEHRKEEDEDGSIDNKEITHEIPRALVETMWKEIIVHQPLNKPIKTSTVAEKMCTLLALNRFFREGTNTFDFAKFFGSRKDYYTYFYLPIKVLVHTGKVKHHKSGKIERLI